MSLLDACQRLQTGLDYHLARHNLLASNLTHVDTPGFQPLDLERTGTSFEAQMHLALAQTDGEHLGTSPHPETSADWRVVNDPTATPGADGNAVSLDREAVKIAANQIRYDTLASLMSNELSGLDWAARDGSGA